MRDVDPIPLLIEAAVDTLVGGDALAAEELLKRIDRRALVSARKLAMDAVWAPGVRHRYPRVQVVGSRRANVPARIAKAAFERDHFTCRYCERRTIHLDVLKLLCRAFPRLLPYHPGWKPVQDLIVLWTHSASVEHHVPLARGGTNDAANIVTSCYQCNDVKNYYRAEELGWSLLPPAISSWDGLSSRLPALRGAVADLRAAAPPASLAAAEGTLTTTSLPEEACDSVAFVASPALPRCAAEEQSPGHREALAGAHEGALAESASRASDSHVGPTNSVATGAFVRMRLPQNQKRRSYRVESFDGRVLELREMWREGATGRWVQSEEMRHALLQDVGDLEIVRPVAPVVGASEVS